MKQQNQNQEQERLQKILSIDQELNRIQDLDLLLEQILLNARNVAQADAGSIYTVKDDKLYFRYAQNEEMEKQLPPNEKLVYTLFHIPIDDTTIAGYCSNHNTILSIPDMYNIGDDKPYSFSDRYDKLSGYKTVSSLTFPLTSNQGKVLGALQLLNKKDKETGEIIPFSEDDELIATHFASIATVALQRARMTRTLIMRMIRAARLRDPKETGAHVNRVGSISCEIYESYAFAKGLKPDEITRNRDVLRIAAMLHDVGKVAIPDQILKKPGRLNEDEYKIMQQHTVKGAELLGDTESDMETAALEVALYHHENWDGTGYPGHYDSDKKVLFKDKNGNLTPLSGHDIPLYARIVSIADVYDALCSKRAYKEAWDQEEVLEAMREMTGTKFDPELMKHFFKTLPNIRHIQDKYPDN